MTFPSNNYDPWFSSKNMLIPLIITYMKKFLDFDWLRAVQFQSNSAVSKKGNTVICTKLPFLGTELPFSQNCITFWCILLIAKSMPSRAIWKKHAFVCFSKTIKIAKVRRTHSCMFFTNCTGNHAITGIDNVTAFGQWTWINFICTTQNVALRYYLVHSIRNTTTSDYK